MTSSINPSKNVPFLLITDPQERLFQTYCSLISWIKNTEIKSIILCDNTEIDHNLFSGIAQFAQQHQKHMEILIFKGNYEKVSQQGKGFGEGEIMKYVIKQSQLLRRETVFYKITGRIFVSNFNNIEDSHHDKKVVFDCLPIKMQRRILWELAAKFSPLRERLRRSGEGFVDTVFYKCNVGYYIDNLMECFNQVNDKKEFYLEHSFFFPILRSGFNPFIVKPLLVGKRGTLGSLYEDTDYSNDIKDIAKLLLSSVSVSSI